MKSNHMYNQPFSHIYVERSVMDHPRTLKILAKFPNAHVVEIGNYKEIFNRRKQDPVVQHRSRALILAAAEGINVYPGARVCQDFGNDHFYYTSNVMNCIFDCDYCYLKGMYPSGNMVVFVNLEDTFREVEDILRQHSAYICVSYDTDLTAIEDITGFVEEWSRFTADHPGLTIEVRTKSARCDIYSKLSPCERVIFAFTMSPERVAAEYEHGSGSPEARLEAIRTAMDLGHPVRLCFDPMIYIPGWEKEYGCMFDHITDRIELSKVRDVSVGSFRISQEYMKQMRKKYPASPVVQFPYDNRGGVYRYPDRIRVAMEHYLTDRLSEYIPRDRIFLWDE